MAQWGKVAERILLLVCRLAMLRAHAVLSRDRTKEDTREKHRYRFRARR